VKRRYAGGDTGWTISGGSVLDTEFLSKLPTFDVVYCWGVLHHTGAMWDALANVVAKVGPGGRLFIAIYNDQGRASRMWLRVKRAYNALPDGLKWLVLGPAFVRLWGPTFARDTLRRKPLATWRGYSRSGRGMSAWRDVVDWVGGYPFEVAKPEEVFEFCLARGLALCRMKTQAGGLGCNEFVFGRTQCADGRGGAS
jgi:2-polyprenyl-6-hydroxyphenyl methylase/3-demethylubiquinone-9 3-methyltransferase